jgi:hypothetical protein
VLADEMRRKEAEELKQTIAEMKRKTDDPLEYCEGETDVEDIFDTPSANYEEILSEKLVKKKPKRQGPTLRSHSQVEHLLSKNGLHLRMGSRYSSVNNQGFVVSSLLGKRPSMAYKI